MEENKIELKYLGICSKNSSPGVYKKIKGFIKGAQKKLPNSSYCLIEPKGWRGYSELFKEALASKQNLIMIRYLPRAGLLFFFLGFILNLRKQKLIIDVPTPQVNLIKEILLHNKTFFGLLNILLIYLQAFIPFITAYKVLQYSNESSFFTFGLKKRVLLIGNGVDVDSITLRKNQPNWPSAELRLIAVGTIAAWHGWDKILNIIYEIKNSPWHEYSIKFTVVGDGPDLKLLKDLVKKYGISDSVIFTGHLDGQDLLAEYEKSHIAVGSLGWDRIGVDIASPLKYREYLAVGIPFVYMTKDVDFDEDSRVAILVKSSDELKLFLLNMKAFSLPAPSMCREYAKENLDFSKKVMEILRP
ncbi:MULTISPECIES: glycosyltransferase [Shewanella]|uniref:glycosyltransferase n=1 Tax=Shewanella TaxID=22 RepID=UPI001DBDA3B9|nr:MULTISPECIES: glycosyltransferase [Shewanella]NCO69852.1 glycosyltransferase [Shewanella vesiculosa]